MPRKAVFLDTNGRIALLNSADLLHPLAKSTWIDLGKRGYEVILTDWIVAETGDGSARTPARARFAEAVNLIRSSPRTRLLSVSPEWLEEALDLYNSRDDKSWGLIDCASVVAMEQLGIP